MKILRLLFPSSILVLSFALSSCTLEKARALRIGAVQFKAESFTCIDAIDTMRQRELESPPQLQAEVQREFVNNILTSDSPIILPDEIELARSPNAVTLEPSTEKAWADFVSKLKEQYGAFAAIYDRLEAGSYLAAEAVSKSAEHAENLSLQMAAFAKVLVENPPALIQSRTDISAKLTRLKREYQQRLASNADEQSLELLRQQAGEYLNEWEQVSQKEQELLKSTITPCLKAAVLGKELRQLSDRYETLDLDTLNSIIARIFDTAASLTGQDYNALKLKATTLIAEIQDDEHLKPVVEEILQEVNQGVTSRNPSISDSEELPVPVSFWLEMLNQKVVAQSNHNTAN